MYLSSIIFGAIAAFLVWAVSRKNTNDAPRLTAAAIALLLLIPVLSLLPKLPCLPAVDLIAAEAKPGLSWLPAIWFAGALLFGSRVLTAWITIQRWKRRSRPIESRRLRDGRTVEIRILHGSTSAHAIGIAHPVVFLPTESHRWSDQLREIVLAHEMAHHERRDPLWRLLSELACALHWFNPFAWWLSKRHALQSEFACDARVVSSGIREQSYARALCDLATHGSSNSLASAMNDSSGLHARVQRLIEPPRGLSKEQITTLVALILAIGLGLVLLRPKSETLLPREPEIQMRLNANPFPGNP